MEKKIWTMPQAEVEQFEMNQYIAACGDNNTVYKFTCTTGGGVSGYVYEETNEVEGLQTESKWNWETMTFDYRADKELGGYHACNKYHESPTSAEYLNGYYKSGSTVIPVIIWRGNDGRNIHCNENLIKDSWETAKS